MNVGTCLPVTTRKLLAGPFVIGSLRTVFVYQAAESVRHSTRILASCTGIRTSGGRVLLQRPMRPESAVPSESRTRSGPVAGAVLA